MRAVLMGILGFVIGLVGTPLLLLIGYGIFMAVTAYHDFEGATAMGLATFVAPFAALVGGSGMAAFFVHISRPRRPV